MPPRAEQRAESKAVFRERQRDYVRDSLKGHNLFYEWLVTFGRAIKAIKKNNRGRDYVGVNQIAMDYLLFLLQERSITINDLKLMIFFIGRYRYKTGSIVASIEDMVQATGVNRTSVSTSLNKLCRFGLLYRDNLNAYTFGIPSQIVAPVSRNDIFHIGEKEKAFGLRESDAVRQVKCQTKMHKLRTIAYADKYRAQMGINEQQEELM